MIEQNDRLRWHDTNDPRTRLDTILQEDRTSNSRMWLQGSDLGSKRRSRLEASLSPRDIRGGRSRRLPVACDTGHSSTGRREAHSQFEHNANPPQLVGTVDRHVVALKFENERLDVLSWSQVS